MNIDAILSKQTVKLENISDILKNLKIGDVMRAQVLDATLNELLLKLFDGTVLQASTIVDISAEKGEYIDLKVSGKNKNQIFLETVKNKNESQVNDDLEIKKELIVLGIKPNEKNLEIAREIKSSGMPFCNEIFKEISDALAGFKGTDIKKILLLISNNIELEEKNINTLIRLTDDKFRIGAELDKLQKLLSNSGIEAFSEDADKLLLLKKQSSFDSHDLIVKEFKNIFIKTDSKNLKSELNGNRIYKEIFTRLEAVRQYIETSGTSKGAEIKNVIDNIESSIKFFNDIKNYNTYLQIPINIFGRNTTGELYILKNEQKKKKINPEDMSMLISLNTSNLGRIDSLVSINRKNLSINIRVEDQKIINFIKENFKLLYTGLADKGFKIVDIRYRLITDDINILNIEEVVRRETGDNRITFDYKV